MTKQSKELIKFFGTALLGLLFFGLLILVLSFFIPKAGAAEVQESSFPITVNLPHVWEWSLIKEDTPSGEPHDLFVLRYFQAPETEKLNGMVGLTISMRDIPELGVLYQIWNIKLRPSGSYDFSSAIYAHRLDDNQWLVAPTGFIVKAGLGRPTDAVSVIVYRRSMGMNPKYNGREKIAVEYKVQYSRLTIKSIFFRMFDPASPTGKPFYFELNLEKIGVGEKVIEKERRLK